MNKRYKITVCGLCCDLCEAKTTHLQDAAKKVADHLKDPMNRAVISRFNPQIKGDNLTITQGTLETLSNSPPCPGCEKRADCSIKNCNKQQSTRNCSECPQFNVGKGICVAPPTPAKLPFLPPAPIFFNGLSRRYQNWNVENLRLIREGNLEAINQRIAKLRAEKKSSQVLVDTSVNLFQMKPPPK